MEYRKELQEYLAAHQDEMLADIKELVDIDSVRTEALPGMPFGEGPAKCLAKACEIMEKYGLKVTNYDNYVAAGDFGPEERQLDILAHTDVVPVSEADWTVTKPFEAKVVGDRMYGRGTVDDKGPAIIALYAIRAIKELGLPLKKGVRLILGSAEETGSEDLEYYFQKETSAPATLSPDAEYPLVAIEKGRLATGFTAAFPTEPKAEGAVLVCFDAGTAVNIVPNKAYALLSGIKADALAEIVKAAEARTGVSFTLTEEEEGLRIAALGQPAHASTPYMGNNALTGLVDLLAEVPFADAEAKELLTAVRTLFPHGDFYGHALGVDLEDEKSGKTTLTLDILKIRDGALCGQFDSRASIAATKENTTDVVREKLTAAGFTPDDSELSSAHIVDPQSPLVKTLMGIYGEVTGRTEEKPLAIGGGTYVHDIDNGVAFGCEFPEVDNHMHGDDEFMEIPVMLLSAELYALAILELCNA